MSHDAECLVFDVLHHRHEWWVPGKINSCRNCLKADRWKRDVLMLDCALENWQVTRLQATNIKELRQDDALNVMVVLLESLSTSRDEASIHAAYALFKKVLDIEEKLFEKWSPEWCRCVSFAACCGDIRQ